jgi:O-antigen/teichoic acid export membrane protein
MKSILKKILPKGEFAKNTLTLTLGTSIAQFFPLLFYPILGRIFTPEEFGLLATLTSITAILGVLATGKYDQGILIADSKKEAADLVGFTVLLSLIVLTISFITLQVFSSQVAGWFSEPLLSKWLWIPPLNAFVIIIFNSFNEWCVRHKYFTILSWNKITNSASHTLGKVFFGFVKISGNGLVVGDLLGRTFSAGTCVYRAWRIDRSVLSKISTKQFKVLSKKYIDFPKYLLPDQLINTLGVAIPVLFIGVYFNSTEVGYYSMTMQVLLLPISLISRAVRDVFRQRANEDFVKHGNCISIYKKLLVRLTLLGLIGSFAIIAFLPSIFGFVLGQQWEIAGQYSQILLPMMTLSFISMSLSGVFVVVRKMKISLLWQIYYTAITVTSLLIGFFIFKTMMGTLLCFAVGRGSAYLLYIILSYKYSKGSKNEFF